MNFELQKLEDNEEEQRSRGADRLINQFPRILNALNQDISSYSDADDTNKFPVPVLSAPTRKLVRWWLAKAQKRLS